MIDLFNNKLKLILLLRLNLFVNTVSSPVSIHEHALGFAVLIGGAIGNSAVRAFVLIASSGALTHVGASTSPVSFDEQAGGVAVLRG